MSIALFCENLGALSASRVRSLNARLEAEGLSTIEAVYALVWPDYAPPNPPRPQDNRAAFVAWRNEAGVPLWAWFNCSKEQAEDALRIEWLDETLDPDGWLLDIEGEWTKGAKLKTLLEVPAATEKPRSVSLAGIDSSHVEYDYREFERQGYDVDWQAYFNSGEGPEPGQAIRELYQSSFVIAGWDYRHRLGATYGWGKVMRVERDELARFDSYLRPGSPNAVFGVLPREWGFTVEDRILWPPDPDDPPSGLLMGRTAYARIRCTLNVTRPLPAGLTWEGVAATARVASARKRPVSVYLAENASDDVIVAIARGAT